VLGIAPRGASVDDALGFDWSPCEVSLLAERVGEQLGLSPNELRVVSLGTLLVELSKLAVSERSATRRDSLGEREWRAVRHRARQAVPLLAGTADALGVRSVVDGCCERWDGSGSPEGLAGEAIPVGARILAVCDAFCARTRAADCSPGKALLELGELNGTRFDPACVQALVGIVR
jgi:HD-GYP domain-containing protein (c-di-GMP phosphodiesterase class II)